MKFTKRLRDERGIALAVAMLVAVAVAAITVGATMLSTNAASINRYNERLSVLEAAAEAGVEEGRSSINGDNSLYPSEDYNTLENGAPVTDAGGAPIPNIRRYTYVGPTGVTTGQYGVFGSIISVAEDDFGNRVVRRGEISQESFAKFAYFTTVEGNIWFANGDQIWGPVHSNDRIRIHSSGAEFHSTVESGEDVYQNWFGTFHQGFTEWGKNIPMPGTADLTDLQIQAANGNTDFVGNTAGGHGEATTRIEFIALDLNLDGDSTDANEGFFTVYQHLGDANWVSGDPRNGTDLDDEDHCGDYHAGVFISTNDHPADGHNAVSSVQDQVTRRCLLGGVDSLWAGVFNPGPDPQGGSYIAWPAPPAPAVVAAVGPVKAQYLFPLSRAFNPGFRGVIFIEGKVAIHGTLRGRVTLAATDDIVIADDIVYATDPGAGLCADILGIFSGDDVVIADNPINAPWMIQGISGAWRTFDDTQSEFIHGVILALDIFTVENYNTGSDDQQPCAPGVNGRGCIFLTGGIIQRQRGAVGLTSGQGYLKRYSYDACVLQDPPPYFPTTGYFERGRLFEIDPTNFDVAAYYQMLTP